MAKNKKKRSRIASVEVRVIFHPREDDSGVQLNLRISETSKKDSLICKCKHEGFSFYYFRDMIKAGETLMAVPMVLPNYFEQIEKVNEGASDEASRKRDVRALFLLRTGISQASPETISGFFGDILHHGNNNCPQLVRVTDEVEDDKVEKKKYSRGYFTFNKMRFYPFLMREFTVGYFVCDDHAKKYHWPAYDPRTYLGIGVDQPIVYESTLGLFVTRDAKYLTKGK